MQSRVPTDSERRWLEVRRFLERRRFELGVEAANEYGAHLRVSGTPLLTTPAWMPKAPIELDGIQLTLLDEDPERHSSSEYGAALPVASDGSSYEDYADVYQVLAAPRVFENRSTYRLIKADLSTGSGNLVFGRGRYFDSLNTGEASAHAYAAATLGHDPGSIRRMIDDPCSLTQRPVNLAVSALTLRRDAATGYADFFLHWRDPGKVGHAGGLYQVVPSGVFQASGSGDWNHQNDFSLIRFLIRESAEELGGREEVYDNLDGALNYDEWQFARRLIDSLENGLVQAWCVGLGVDPLTFATDLLAVVVFDSAVFEELFGEVVPENDEGRVLSAKPFVEAEVMRLIERERMQAAGAALLAAGWQFRDLLLRDPVSIKPAPERTAPVPRADPG